MATVTKYDVLSPDKFSISFDEVWDTPEEAKEALKKWIGRYKQQGYYSTSNRERIPLDELETWCEIVPIEVDEPENIGREDAIKMLIDNDFDTIEQGFQTGDSSYLYDLLTMGMKGYDNFTDEELTVELNESFSNRDNKKYLVV